MKDETYLKELGARINKARTLRKLSMQNLADQVGFTSRSTISKIESGERNISISKIKIFARALRVDPMWIMNGDINNIKWIEPEVHPIVKLYESLSDCGQRKLFEYGNFLKFQEEEEEER